MSDSVVTGKRHSGAVLVRIRGLRGSLTPSEDAVAQVVLAEADQIVGTSVEALAGLAGVSTATVMRLCHTLGFSGFKDFKISLARERGSASPAVLQEEIRPADTALQLMRKVVHSEAQALHETLDLLDEECLESAIDALAHAHAIELYGMGSSTPVVIDAYYRFARIGLRVSTPPDSHMQAVNAALLKQGDVAMMISHTGRTQELLAAAAQAKAAGATIIAVTSYLRSPLLALADIPLVAAVTEATSRVEAMASRTVHLAIVDCLYVALAMRLPGQAKEALSRTQAVIDGQRA